MEDSGVGPAALCELLLRSRGKCYRDGPSASPVASLLRKAETGAGERQLPGEARGTLWSLSPADKGGGGERRSRWTDREMPSRGGGHLEAVRFDEEPLRVKRFREESAAGGVLRPVSASPGRARREGERRRLKRQLEAMRRQIQQLQGRISRARGPVGLGVGRGAGPQAQGGRQLAQALKEELGRAVVRVVDTVVKMLAPGLYVQAAQDLPALRVTHPPGTQSLPCPGPAFLGRNGHWAPAPGSQVEALLPVARSCCPEESLAGSARAGTPRCAPAPGCSYQRSALPPSVVYALPAMLACREHPPPEVFSDFLGFRVRTSSPRDAHSSAKGLPVTKSESLDLPDGADVQVYGADAEGLSPGHLKKAKLIFFYSRYPSSNTLKTYFPDVKFNRCITSQLIKWFSNFREFFYIQVEKFARQAQNEGASSSEQLIVNRDSDLFRTLNQHFNKSSEFEVPDKFLQVSHATLHEFFDAIVKGRDTDPSWKKPIYKVISKLDSDIPDLFKSPGGL
ncbi:prospero homeobox protein 1-like isoform X2 [Heterodontus francisci]|uniref:prospero homeobox protein 1-like isoform X2 n=1 Tax=Heterodontus francisci TaxID=7792 RepID=UPI00355C3429